MLILAVSVQFKRYFSLGTQRFLTPAIPITNSDDRPVSCHQLATFEVNVEANIITYNGCISACAAGDIIENRSGFFDGRVPCCLKAKGFVGISEVPKSVQLFGKTTRLVGIYAGLLVRLSSICR